MKNLFLILIAVFATTIVTAQTSCCSNDSTSGVDIYVSAGLSISNNGDTTFAYTSYPSVELGFMKNNFSLGLVVGRGNFTGIGKVDYFSNYWTELKAAVYLPIKKFNAYALFGVGSYFEDRGIFIEYGAGFSYSFNKFGIFTQASNWDNYWYVTPGISYTF